MPLSEQGKIIHALETAIKMEIDGKAFYMKASTTSINQAGKKLFIQLAGEEDAHRQQFEQIYAQMRKEKAWPDLDIKPVAGIKTLFSRDGSPAPASQQVDSNEIGAVNTALDMERKSCDFYETQMRTASQGSEAGFYQALAQQERGHELALLDYLEFLQNPSAYFARVEHHSLDGA